MISWQTCKQDFQWDGSWRDIYITPATLEDWQAIFPFLRVQPEVEFSMGFDASSIPESIDLSCFADVYSMLRFRVGGVLVIFHFFIPEEIECSLDPREVTGQDSLNAVLALMQQLGDLTGKRAVLTPENCSAKPIISYEPESRAFQYHEAA